MSPTHLSVRPARSLQQRAFIGVGITVAFVSLLSAGAVAFYWNKFGDIRRYDVELSPIAKGAPRNYLIVGSDSRENIDPDDPGAGGFLDDGPVGGKRSDTIMILRIDPEKEKAALLSLPRDLYIPIAGTDGRARINSAYGKGRQVLIDTIRENFQIEIHHYVEVDFTGFRGLVEAIGGVPMWFDTPVRDTHTGLVVNETGCVTLRPQMALNFARSRYLEYQDDDGDWEGDPTSDLGRITRQQIFIRRAISKAKSKATNPVTINKLVDVAVDNVGLDPRLGARDIVSLSQKFADFDEKSLETYALPVESGGQAGAVVIGNQRQAERILNVFRGLNRNDIPPRLIDVEVLNGTGAENQATDVASALQMIGFTIAHIGDSPDQPVERTTILHAPGDQISAVRLARHVTGSPVIDAAAFLDPGEVVLVTGNDFESIHQDPSPVKSVSTSTSSTSTTVDDGGTATTEGSTTTTAYGIAVGTPPEGQACG